ncbi:hypothetical protein [Nonomuraea sp. bgisy101]|uniref:hypothetical protein n=1 Tax=Nonomuraea sp. bgisy101 TaxID=3413784 RepID=UPI003D70865B
MADTKINPVEELGTAAAKLRHTAAEAHGGPWARCDVGVAVISADVQLYGAPCIADRLYEPDADWITLAHPGLAEPLAAWLDDHASDHSTYDCGWDDSECPALSLAREINGGGRG